MPDLNSQYEGKHLKLIANLAKRIKSLYEASIVDISFIAATANPKASKFSLSTYPLIEKKIDQQLQVLHKDIYAALVSGVKNSWDLSNKKNDLIVDRRLAGKRPTAKGRQILYDPNREALNAFLGRKTKGMDLSRRVWKAIKPFKKELEQSIGLSIGEGKSAAKMATELKKYLNEPDKLFKRVRGEDGKLKLSAAAKDYHPGQGVYRSSYKNALRLSRTENNMAYRSADFERWQKLPFVVGVEIRLSNNHPKFDICDSLKGRYPKNFKFRGWHPQCLCYATPVMMNDEEYDKLEDQILSGEPINVKSTAAVDRLPNGFVSYYQKNKEKIDSWSNTPYWVSDNKKYIKTAGSIKKPKVEEVDLSKLDIEKYVARVKKEPFKSVFPNLTDEMKASINGYTDHEYFRLNNFLRGQNVSDAVREELTNYRNLLNNSLDEISERYQGVVFRGSTLKSDAVDMYKNAFKSNGTVVHEYFTSTSYSADSKFNGNTYFTIKSKNGRKIEPLSEYQSEKEVLFKAGSKFKVVNFNTYEGVNFIEMEEI